MPNQTGGSASPAMRVEVQRKDLVAALSTWRGLKASQFPAEAQVYLDGDALVIDSGGNAVEVPCKGSWEGVARVPMSYFLGLIGKLPADLSLDIRAVGDRFYIGSSSIGCALQPVHVEEPSLTLNPSLPEILALAYSRTPTELEQAGLRLKVDEANEKAANLVDNAMVHLAKLGIDREQLVAFIRLRLSGVSA